VRADPEGVPPAPTVSYHSRNGCVTGPA